MNAHRTFPIRLIACVALVIGLFQAPPESVGATPARKAEAGLVPYKGDWLSKIVLDELDRAHKADQLAGLAERLEAAILARLRCGHLDKLKELNDMVYALRAARALPTTKEVGGKDFADFLAGERKLTRLFCRALGKVSLQRPAIERLCELYKDDSKRVVAYPNLAVAFATTLAVHDSRQEKPATMVESFHWYTNRKMKFRYNLKKMPFELSRYLADTRLSIRERRWARKRYPPTKNAAKTYFDVPYDNDHFKKGRPKKIAKVDYTLANLDRVGGVCIDQAYYASQVCKAMGIPAAVVIGRGQSGLGHAWIASLDIPDDAKKARWDSTTGRYESHRYYTGMVRDPVTNRPIHDSEMMIAGIAAQLSLSRREEADTAVALARMVGARADDANAGDLAPLQKLAQLYDERFAGGDDKLKADVKWIRPARKLDVAMIEDLLAVAIDRNLAHRPVWEFIVELRLADRLPEKHLGRFFDVLMDKTAKRYPDYSCLLVLRVVPTIKKADRREKLYKRFARTYRSRADLLGRILIALGDEYSSRRSNKKAVKAYMDAAERAIDVPNVVLDAAGRAEQMYLSAGKQKSAIRMLEKLFAKSKRSPDTDTTFRRYSVRYQLGSRLAELYERDGKKSAARRIRKKMRD